jgi:alpha-mannosidase
MSEILFTPGAALPEADAFRVDLAKGELETPLYQIAWDAEGRLTSLVDKARGRQALSGPANLLEIYEDKPLKYDNWDIDIFHVEKRETLAALGPAELVELGGERCALRFRYAYNRSSFTQDMIVYKDCPRIDFKTQADWHEKDRLLKAAFPAELRANKASYDIQFGHLERPAHWNTSWDWARFEVVGHKWADLSESDYGLSLLNDCKYGYSVKDSVLRLSSSLNDQHPSTIFTLLHPRRPYS